MSEDQGMARETLEVWDRVVGLKSEAAVLEFFEWMGRVSPPPTSQELREIKDMVSRREAEV